MFFYVVRGSVMEKSYLFVRFRKECLVTEGHTGVVLLMFVHTDVVAQLLSLSFKKIFQVYHSFKE